MTTTPNFIGAKVKLLVEDVFSGVNYLESLSSVQGNGLSALSGLISPDEQGYLQSNTNSIFNKFTVFEYSKFNAGSRYRIDGHFIGFSDSIASKTADQFSKENKDYINSQIEQAEGLANDRDILLRNIGKDRKRSLEAQLQQQGGVLSEFKAKNSETLSNPNAAQLIKWGAEKSAATPVGFQPYSLTDFMFCKNYGKIPNNRLVTLRRYPFPIADSVRLPGAISERKSMLPVAQAVTWFGSETQNTINSMGVFSWDMPWKDLEVSEPQIIDGNEITLNELTQFATGLGPGGEELASMLQKVYATAVNSDATRQQISKYEEKIIRYQKDLYDQTKGPYWNRVYGPVNVINKSSRRDRGIQNSNWNTPFTINFHYSFRSFNGLSPKIAALDLISNFANLTYNDAQFLGQLSRYFPKPGIKFDPTVTEALGTIMKNLSTTTTGNSSTEISKVLSEVFNLIQSTSSKLMNNPFGVAKDFIMNNVASYERAGQIAPDIISIKSALSDRPTGEWHIVVGNPMNPIFVMGNLIVTNTKMTWDEELGPDDFPTGVKFEVTLRQAQPRDKTAIERMLNLGQGKLTTGNIRTSAYSDTFGEENNADWNELGSRNQAGSQTEAQPAGYEGFKQRFIKGYGYSNNSTGTSTKVNANVDDSILLMYFQRQYGKN